MQKKELKKTKYQNGQDYSEPLQPSFAKPSLDSHLAWKNSEQSLGGLHSGKGPKGYRRSDERIREEINEALTRHPEVDASEVEVSVKDAVVTLSGTIESRQMKQLAEDCTAKVSGVKDVKNELRIDATYATRSRTSEFGAQESTSRSVRR